MNFFFVRLLNLTASFLKPNFIVRRLSILFFIISTTATLFVFSAHAQEVDISVTVNDDQVSDAGLNHIGNLNTVIEEYINTYIWTEDKFEDYERINAAFQITLNSVDDNFNFDASLVIQLQRPIFGTIQRTPILLILDDNWSFSYPPNKSLIHDEYQYDNLASMIDFYVYIVLGYDYDTFSELGGDPHFKNAYDIMSLAQSNGGTGWDNSQRQGRYELINSLQRSSYESLRVAMYKYHREGLDRFPENPQQARNNVLEALELIDEAKRKTTSSYLFDQFFNTKYKEITSIFMDAELQQKLEVYNLLTDLDPSHISEYDKLQWLF